MKIIQEIGTTSLAFRFDKVSQYATPSYIFETIDQNSNEKLIFTTEDLSPSPLTYQLFDFVNGVPLDEYNARFDLRPGKYFLNVYETDSISLNIASASRIWYGEMKVDGEQIPDTISFTQSDSDVTIYFDNEYKTIKTLNLIAYQNLVDFPPVTQALNGSEVYLYTYDVNPLFPPQEWTPTQWTFYLPTDLGTIETITTIDSFYEWQVAGSGTYELKVVAENDEYIGTATMSFIVI